MALKRVRLPDNTVQDIHDARIAGIDSELSSQSSNPLENSAIDAEFEKVTYLGETLEEVDPIDDEPEPDPVIIIGGDGEMNVIEAITFNGSAAPIDASTKTAAISVPIAELIGGMNRDNVSGNGGLSITNTFGTFPTISTPGTYIVSTRLRSTTQSFTLTVNFGTTYTISTSNGYAYDERAITISSSTAWSGSITSVNSGTGCEVRIYRATDYKVENLGRVAITNSYSDLYNKPTIPSAVTESTVSGWGFTKNTGTVTQVKVGTTEYNPSSGVVSLPAYPTTLPASDVSAWAKASTKPTYTASEVGALPSTTSIPTESTVSGWGFTKNTGTLTGVKFNGTNASVSNGVATITATIPAEVTESTVSGWGFTKNAGTLTGVTFNGANASVSNGVAAITATIPAAVTESTVSGWGFTKNSGTITGITMNGSSKGTSGTVNLGTVVTAETDPVFTASAAHGISSTDISNWNAKQKAITVSSSEPTSSQGSNGDIWIVI